MIKRSGGEMLFPPMGRMIPSVRFVGICFLILFCRMLLKQKKWPGRQGQKCLPLSYLRGKLCSPKIIFISGEQELLIKINGGHTEAPITFLLLYFVCYVQYPKECVNVHLFLERYILKVYDSARLPTKLLQFLNVLNC